MDGINSLRSKIKPTAIQVVTRLVQNGYEAFVVGGAVRDLLLGCVPKDYDITTNATPEEVRAVFGHRNCVVIGRRFRLAQVRVGEDLFEVSTFRRKPTEDERKGRDDDEGIMIWNDNEYGTLDDDVLRRDFTVNALYLDVVGKRGVIDKVGGLADLKAGIVRVVGDADERFEEDPVRMLRALKLVGQHGFKLDNNALEALRNKRALITLSSVARLYEELLKIFFTGHSLNILAAFHTYGFLTYFWPQLEDIWKRSDGIITRRLLKARDQEINTGKYSHSRALALATACLPTALRALRPENEEEDDGQPHADTNKLCMDVIRNFYGNFIIPRLYTIRVKEILLLIPVLSSEETASRWFHHKEYKYGRLLLSLLVKTMGWDQEIVDRLPEPEAAAAYKRRRKR